MYLAQGGEEVLAPPNGTSRVLVRNKIKSLYGLQRDTNRGMESGSNGTIRPADLEQTVPLIHKTNLDSRISCVLTRQLYEFSQN